MFTDPPERRHPYANSIAICDDDPVDCAWMARLTRSLDGEDIGCFAFTRLSKLLGALMASPFLLLVLDDRLGLERAETSMAHIASVAPDMAVVVVTGDLPPGRREILLRLGAMECISKEEVDLKTLQGLLAMARSRTTVFDRLPRRAVRS